MLTKPRGKFGRLAARGRKQDERGEKLKARKLFSVFAAGFSHGIEKAKKQKPVRYVPK